MLLTPENSCFVADAAPHAYPIQLAHSLFYTAGKGRLARQQTGGATMYSEFKPLNGNALHKNGALSVQARVYTTHEALTL